MTAVRQYSLFACIGLLIFVIGCGAGNVTAPTASIPVGETHRLEISDCPNPGDITTVFITNHGVGPNGASISGLSQSGVLPHNGRVQIDTPCGKFDLGRYVANQDTGIVDLYLETPRKL